MIRIPLLLAAFFLACTAGFAASASAPASDESIRELLRLSDAKALVEGARGQIDAMMKAGMQDAVGGRPLTEKEQAIADKVRTKTAASLRETMAWERLEPMYFKIYREAFTQAELDGIIAFYKTPAGQAMIKKLPVVMQQTMTAMQELMGPMMQKLETTMEETVAELKAAEAGK